MLKRIAALTLLGSAFYMVACAPPAMTSLSSDRDSTDKADKDDGDVTGGGAGDEEDCVDEEESSDRKGGSFTGLDIEALSACECPAGGAARCVPSSQVPKGSASKLAKCDDGVCVPDSLVKSGGAAPKTCESVAGEGRCVSLCIPQVAEKKDVLDRGVGDVCEPDELCAPCLNPLEGNKPTGVCEIGGSSSSSKSTSGSKCKKAKKTTTTNESDSGANSGGSCPYAGKPIDVSTFEPCGSGGRCVPETLVPQAQRTKLDACTGGLCAPEKSVMNAGKFLPPTCVSVAGAEGRCLSTVIRDIGAKEGLLPRSTCDANELCAPCFNPSDGEDTGACRTVSCDAPKEEPKTFAQCCEGKGRCVPETSVSASQKERLGSEGCQEGAELCAPTEDINRTTKRPSCNGTLKLLGKAYVGACVSRCTDLGLQGKLLDQATCDDDHICAPCVNPITQESTGACD